MDQTPLHQMPLEGSGPSSHSLASQSFTGAQNGDMQQRTAPEDVDSALRYTPLTSVVPVSGGTFP
jgi:hypothetical protein